VVGSSLCITDDDLESALSSVGLGILFQAVLNCTGSTKKRHAANSAGTAANSLVGGESPPGGPTRTAEIELPEVAVTSAVPAPDRGGPSYSNVQGNVDCRAQMESGAAADPPSALAGYRPIAAGDEQAGVAGEFDKDDLPPQYGQDHDGNGDGGDGRGEVPPRPDESGDHWKWSGAHETDIDDAPPPYI
jgi:hypothetical protein